MSFTYKISIITFLILGSFHNKLNCQKINNDYFDIYFDFLKLKKENVPILTQELKTYITSTIKINSEFNCVELYDSLNISELKSNLTSIFKDNIEDYQMDYILSSVTHIPNFCSFITYFYVESNGLTIQENQIKNNIIWEYGIEKLSEGGKNFFFDHYEDVHTNLYKYNGI